MNLRPSLAQYLSPFLVALALAAPGAARADDAPGIDPTSASTPQTPQSPVAPNVSPNVLGVVDPSTGTLSLAIPFAVPPARGKVSSSLSLVYASTTRDSDAGVGWSLSLPTIERRGPSGLIVPTYNDSTTNWDEHDTYLYGGRPLVPVCQLSSCTSDQLQPQIVPQIVIPVVPWYYYRLQVDDGSDLRFFFSGDHRTWVCLTKEGLVLEFGAAPDANYASSTDAVPASPYRWHLARQLDNNSNVVVYLWRNEQLTDVYDTAGAGLGEFPPTLAGFAHHTHIAYAPYPLPRATPVAWLWTPATRITNVDVTSATLAGTGGRQLTRRYWFAYQEDFHHSQLLSITPEGRCPTAVPEDGTTFLLPASTSCGTLPGTRFTYSSAAPINTKAVATGDMTDQGPLIVDVNADGFPDAMSVSYAVINSPNPFTGLNTVHIAMNWEGNLSFSGSLQVPGAAIQSWADDWHQLFGNSVIGDFLGDGVNDFLIFNAPPWYREPVPSNGGGAALASNPPYSLQGQILSPAFQSSTSGSWVTTSSADAALINWNLADQTHGLQEQIGLGGGPDLNGDGLNDTLGSQGDWADLLTNVGGFSQGVIFGTKSRTGQITPLGAPQVTGAIPPGVAWQTTTSDSPWTAAVDAWNQRDTDRRNQGLSAVGAPPHTSPWLMADMDGDGLVDLVVPTPSPETITSWHNNGDGTFGTGVVCNSVGTCDYSVASGTVLQGTPNVDSDNVTVYLHDVNGDGLADFIYPHVTGVYDDVESAFFCDGIDVTLNLDGLNVSPDPIFINGATDLGGAWANLGSPLAFADMNGNGVDDIVVLGNDWDVLHQQHQFGIVYVDLLATPTQLASAARPGLLTGFVNGHGGQESFGFATIPQLWYRAQGRGPAAMWANAYPENVPVVTQVTTNNGLELSALVQKVVNYTYWDPVYDAREHSFRGFRKSQQTLAPDPTHGTHGSSTTTTFLISNCPVSPGNPCTEGVENPYETLRALPLVTEQSDDTGSVFLSTTHTKYKVNPLEYGADGRRIRQVYPETTDTYLYDQALPFVSGGQAVSAIDVDDDSDLVLETGASSLPLHAASGVVHLQTWRTLDDDGNEIRSIDYGIVDGGPVDTPIMTSRTFASVATSGAPVWRPTATSVGYGTPAAPASGNGANQRTYSYDSYGDLTDVYAPLIGTLPLQRTPLSSQTAAPAPAHASADGTVHLVHYVYSSQGAITDVDQPDGHCTHLTYDVPFAQLATQTTVYTGAVAAGATCGPTSLSSNTVYDRGLALVTSQVGADSSLTSSVYDGFGRLTSVYRPDPSALGLASTEPAVTLSYRPRGPNGSWQVVQEALTATTPLTSGGTATTLHETVQYLDGFDQLVLSIDQADTANGDASPWTLNGWVQRATNGVPIAAYAPQWVTAAAAGADGTQYPIGLAISGANLPMRFDAFGRVTSQTGYDGIQATGYVYHATAVDAEDAEQLPGGSHVGAYTTLTGDGHGRVASTTSRLHTASGLDSAVTQTTYLATGQVRRITRSHSLASDTYVRALEYDSLNRVVENDEPNTSTLNAAWRYAYDDAGDVVGTSDARGCGENLTYDAAGRVLTEDFSPCAAGQPAYSAPGASGNGTEAYYVYDQLDPDGATPPTNESFWMKGRLAAVYDRGAHTDFVYDGRGRVTQTRRQIAAPGAPAPALASRYAPHWYATSSTFDEVDRERTRTTGADVPGLLDLSGNSIVTTSYTARGLVGSVTSGYRALLQDKSFDAFGRPLAMTLGDVAGTNVAYTYDPVSQRLSEYAVQRTAPALWKNGQGSYSPPAASPPSSLQTLLIDDVFTKYDRVGNPQIITDNRNPAEWPSNAQPIGARAAQYDDFYRLTSLTYATGGTYVHPLAGVPSAAPPVKMPTGRIKSQSYAYDWQGNMTSSDDDEHAFFERSLGTIGYGTTSGIGPNQLIAAKDTAGDILLGQYDGAGNMASVVVAVRSSLCASACETGYFYDWDEVGRLLRARRWDPSNFTIASGAATLGTPDADLSYAYDATGDRVSIADSEAGATPVYSLRVFSSLRLDDAAWNKETPGDYQRDETTESAYLVSNGQALARVVYAEQDLPTLSSNGSPHVLFQLSDTLGSTSAVIDMATSELVERGTYDAYGNDESDYRSSRWGNFRESFRFTGKEYDAQVGLHYFGARYYAAHLGRWLSPDPLAIHARGGDLNPYAYVHGRVLSSVDPLGLDDDGVSTAPASEARNDDGITYMPPISFQEPSGSVASGPITVTPSESGDSSGGPGAIGASPAGAADDTPACRSFTCHTEVDSHPWTAEDTRRAAEEFGDMSPPAAVINGVKAASDRKLSPPLRLLGAASAILAVLPILDEGAPILAEAPELIGGYPKGTFTPLYDGYPGGARPLGPVRLLPDGEYNAARKLADNANNAIKRGPNAARLGGRQIHEIHPVKFGGDPVSGFNKAYLDQPVHSAYTTWWNALQDWVEK